MSVFSIKTKNSAIVNIEVTEEQAFAFLAGEIKKLQEKLDEYNAMDEFEAGEAAANSLKAKLNKLEADNKLETSYNYEDLKKRVSSGSFAGFLTDNGVEKSLHGSATRALSLGKVALSGLKLAGVTDKAIMKNVAENAIGGKTAAWHSAVISWLLDDDNSEDGQELTEA